jgi:hypothetical protein
MRKIYALLLAMAAALLSFTVASSPASGQPSPRSSVQAQAEQILHNHPGGVQISPTQIAWHNGTVILNLQTPAPGASPNTSFDGCPSGYYCFFEFKNFTGRMLQLSTCNSTAIYFSDYGFQNLTSSWVVFRNIYYLNVYEQLSPSGWNFLWSEPAYAAQSDVGATWDNRADLVDCFPPR